MIIDQGLALIAKREIDALNNFYTKYISARRALLDPIAKDLERLMNCSSEELEGYRGENFMIFRPNPEDFRKIDGMLGEYVGETKKIYDEFSTSFYCFNGYKKEWFEDLNKWLTSRLELGIEKISCEEIKKLKDNIELGEYALFNAITQNLGENFKAAYLFWGGVPLYQRKIKLNEMGEFKADKTQRGHWHYVDNNFSYKPFEKKMDITRRLKEECRIVNPEFIGEFGVFIPNFDDVEAYAILLSHAKTTRVIHWHVPHVLTPETLADIPTEVVFGSYDWVHYDRDFTHGFASANIIVFEILKTGGIVSCRNGWHRKYLEDERFKTLYYNEEGEYALFQKV